jgi:hypothetical protein
MVELSAAKQEAEEFAKSLANPIERLLGALSDCAKIMNGCTGATGNDELILKLGAKCAEATVKGVRECLATAS